jgi:predicted permease
MRRLVERLARWCLDEVGARAVGEALADGQVEAAGTHSVAVRAAAVVKTVAALVRIAAASVPRLGDWRPLRSASTDVRAAARRLRGSPVFTIFAVISLGLGIGMATAVYAVVHAAMGPTPGVRDIDRVVSIDRNIAYGSGPLMNFSWPELADLTARQTTFSAVASWQAFPAAVIANGQATSTLAEFASGDYFRVVGVLPEMGRVLQPADDRPGGPAVAVISHLAWQRMFGGSADVIGRTVRVNGGAFQIVGVAPPAFLGLFNGGLIPTAVWIPLHAAPLMPSSERYVSFDPDDRGAYRLSVRARLAPGVTLSQASADVAAIAASDRRAHPPTSPIDRNDWAVRPLAEQRVFGVPPVVLRTMAATVLICAGLVLLVACSNLANLALARAARRRGELAVRRALGVTRGRLVREILAESVLVAAVGGLGGFVVVRVLVRLASTDLTVGRGALLRFAPAIDARVVAAGLLATLVALLASGLPPALYATRAGGRGPLMDAGATLAPRWRGRSALIALQVAISLVLIGVASLYLADARRLARVDTGVDLDHLAIASIPVEMQGYGTARTSDLAAAVVDRLGHVSGASAVAVSSALPFGLTSIGGAAVAPPGERRVPAAFVAAGPRFFDVTGVRLLRGRAFADRDAKDAPRVAIISEALAQQFFVEGTALGRTLSIHRGRVVGVRERRDETVTVVGIVADVDGRSASQPLGTIYVPFDQSAEPDLLVLARAAGDPASLARRIVGAIHGIDPALGVAEVGTGRDLAGPSVLFQRIMGGLSTMLGVLAFVLALTGLVGVLLHVVASRTREIGIRIALGADRRRIRRLIVGQGLAPVIAGLLVGGFVMAIARPASSAFLVRMHVLPPFNGWAAVGVALLFTLAGAAACYVPARRASSIDPNIALRDT